ncbi:hypothetical protein N7490_008021 [Penicillium lividum]|nr:hypothetical protein N7490_008021 [Penicillium lividum]
MNVSLQNEPLPSDVSIPEQQIQSEFPLPLPRRAPVKALVMKPEIAMKGSRAVQNTGSGMEKEKGWGAG